ncbi:MAG: GNAT family N-acetyltransferase [Microbacteriaceae bacterium]
MAVEDLPELFEAVAFPEVFAGGYGGGPSGLQSDVESFVVWAKSYYAWSTGNVYAIRLRGGVDDGMLIGTSTLGDFDEKNESTHIGWTAYHPGVWATAVNPEVKLLMLGLAFDHGFGRVKIQADALNSRSRSAIARLGATFEGVQRRDAQRADGSWRDAAVFSVIVDEWPAVKAGLESRISDFAGTPVIKRARDAATGG